MPKFILKCCFLVCIFCLFISCSNQISDNSAEKTPEIKDTSTPIAERTPIPIPSKEPVAKGKLKISELKKNPGPGIYATEGYVRYKSGPCDCPDYTTLLIHCKCASPEIIISEKNQPIDREQLKDFEIKILLDSNDQYQEGEKYSFKVEIQDHQADFDSISEVKFIPPPDKTMARNTFTIRDIKTGKVKYGTFFIYGFVTKNLSMSALSATK